MKIARHWDELFRCAGAAATRAGGFAKSRVLTFDEFAAPDMEFEDERGKPVEPAILVDVRQGGRTGARAGCDL